MATSPQLMEAFKNFSKNRNNPNAPTLLEEGVNMATQPPAMPQAPDVSPQAQNVPSMVNPVGFNPQGALGRGMQMAGGQMPTPQPQQMGPPASPQTPVTTTTQQAEQSLTNRGVNVYEGPGGETIATKGPTPSMIEFGEIPDARPSLAGVSGEQFASMTPQAQQAVTPQNIPNMVTRNVDGGSVSTTPSLAFQTAPVATGSITNPTSAGGVPISEFLSSGPRTMTDPQGRMITPGADRSAYEAQAAAREARIEARPDFGVALSDQDRRLAAENQQLAGQQALAQFGQGLVPSMVGQGVGNQRQPQMLRDSELRDIFGDEGMRQAKALQEAGINPITKKPFAEEMLGRQQTQAQIEATQRSAQRMDSREARIERLQEQLGLSPSQALRLVEGVDRIITDPVTGQSVLYDQATGESRPIDMAPEVTEELEGQPREQPKEPSQTLFEMSKRSTGIVPSLKLLAQQVAGQAGMKFGDAPELAQMRQNVATAQQSLIRALSLNPRFPVAEMERIRREVNIEPKAFNDPVTLESKMRGVGDALEIRLQDELDAAKNTNLPRSTRQAARQAANDIGNFIDLLGIQEEDDVGEAPEGVEPELWPLMTPEERALFTTEG